MTCAPQASGRFSGCKVSRGRTSTPRAPTLRRRAQAWTPRYQLDRGDAASAERRPAAPHHQEQGLGLCHRPPHRTGQAELRPDVRGLHGPRGRSPAGRGAGPATRRVERRGPDDAQGDNARAIDLGDRRRRRSPLGVSSERGASRGAKWRREKSGRELMLAVIRHPRASLDTRGRERFYDEVTAPGGWPLCSNREAAISNAWRRVESGIENGSSPTIQTGKSKRSFRMCAARCSVRMTQPSWRRH